MFSKLLLRSTRSKFGSAGLIRPQIYQPRIPLSFTTLRPFSSLQSRMAIKAQLKEFYKFTHPDLFGNAPEKIQETNSESMKVLNEFLRNISTESTHVDGLQLTFYVKPDDELTIEKLKEKGIKFEEAKGEAKKEIEKERESQYGKMNISLDGIKNTAVREVRRKHYEITVNTLIESIQDFWEKEEKGELELDDEFDFSTFGEMKHDWQHTAKPQSKGELKRDIKDRREYIETRSRERFYEDFQKLVVKNVYRDKYGLPKDLNVRPPDKYMVQAVKDSYVAERTDLLQKYSVDPNLVFFHHELEDLEIGYCIKRLHGEHLEPEHRELFKKKLNYISQKLAVSRPEIMLMFGKFQEYFALAPGFIHVPIEFEVDEFNEFLNANLETHRAKTARFIREYKEFETIEKEVCKMLSLEGIERRMNNDFIEMQDHLLAIKHFRKFVKNNPDLLFPISRLTSLNRHILIGNEYQIHSDYMIEIPCKFKDRELEEFLLEAQAELGFSA
ncbi:unnamed protein product [Moneuplotes crassus]|uniref:DUF4460 domain-containing protein n=1 Tax=Euplotes crassus TaxID=5936 RepID=A0AAD1UB41_EUPCR|nr:unnamed protein product [Moneuplotes crassus]